MSRAGHEAFSLGHSSWKWNDIRLVQLIEGLESHDQTGKEVSSVKMAKASMEESTWAGWEARERSKVAEEQHLSSSNRWQVLCYMIKCYRRAGKARSTTICKTHFNLLLEFQLKR